jgi:ferredoxin/flavodoxin---NADP+ reductase
VRETGAVSAGTALRRKKVDVMQQVSALRKDPGVVFPIPANVHAETVVSVRHYTDRLFSFRITRPQSFRFRSGEFVMIGLPNAEKPVFRAYSIASPSWDEEIEFFSIKVPDGPLTSELQKIVPGDTVLMRQKSTGTLVNDALTPGKRLFMISTGTGIAPFASLVRDPETFEMTEGRVTLYSTTTREITPRMGRITRLIESGRFYEDLAIAPLDPETDRIMICGSMHMLNDVKELVEKLGFEEGSNSKPSSFVVERAFVG